MPIRCTIVMILSLTLTAGSSCSSPPATDTTTAPNVWGSIDQIESYHNPIIFEIVLKKSGYSVGDIEYDAQEIRQLLMKYSSLRPKPVLIVSKERIVSEQDLIKFKIMVEDIFKCTSTICIEEDFNIIHTE